MKKLFLLLLFFAALATAIPQNNFFTPIEIQKAYDNGTRAINGKQGFNYWQNKSEYNIDVFVNTKNKTIEGKEKIKYYNNSPDDLNQIVLRLYQDFAKATKSRDWEVGENDFTDGVNIKAMSVNGKTVDFADKKNVQRPGTNLIINLSELVISKSTADIYVEWSFKIPNQDFPRMGYYDETSYMIAYWYPQVSVYDDIDGWDKNDYKGQVEFYNDFFDFDVRIKSDNENLMVWATGVLQNPEDVYNDNVLERYKEKSANIITKEDIESKRNFLRNGINTEWNYKAENVPDFVFSTSNHFLWDTKSLNLSNGKVVKINAVYRPDAYWYKYVAEIGMKVIEFLSNYLVPFPYPSMTVFNGDGGMEYPMMVNDGTTDTWESTVYLTAHEITHSYFPFFMGTNERKYGWMDEGWAVFLPRDFQNNLGKENPENKTTDSDYDVRERNIKNYIRVAGTFYDAPALVPSNVLRSPSYRQNAYSKAALIYDILQDMLGVEVFKNAMREYINEWNGKHPSPYDFFNLMSSSSGKELNWFWKKWFMEYLKPDLAIKKTSIDHSILSITISNEGGLPLPVELNIIQSNGKTINIHKSAEVWKEGNYEVVISEKVESEIKSITLGSKYIPDINPKDNTTE